jgi:3'-phosphoadenosine 5'-phosphosulfate sulfotransferase
LNWLGFWGEMKEMIEKVKADIRQIQAFGTNDGKRDMSRSWEMQSLAKYRQDAYLKTLFRGRKTGPMATAKIKVAKAQSYAEMLVALEAI